MLKQVIFLIQIILGLILVDLIWLQSKGTGIGSTFGGDMGFYGTKRGAERLMFIVTIVVSALFLITSLLGVVL